VLITLEIVQSKPKRHVVKDTGGKRIGLLEHHADIAANGHGIHGRMVNVLTPEVNMAFKPKTPNQIVHAVKAAQNCALPTARRANESCNGVLLYGDDSVPNSLEGPVIEFSDVAVNHHLLVRSLPYFASMRIPDGLKFMRVTCA
jgi:hypothetical protein